MKENTEFYFYTVNPNTNRRITVAGFIINNQLHIGSAECSLKDQFVKRKGRDIAMGRAKSKKALIFDLSPELTPIKQFIGIIETITDSLVVNH